MLLALCNSPVMRLRLYLIEVFEDEWAGIFLYLMQTFVSISHPRRMISISKDAV